MKNPQEYYLGLDIGTDSVGYAVTGPRYSLLKFKGEPMWGTHLFEGGQEAAERRAHRASRRRIDRRQQRVMLVNELFAEEIGKIDPNFFIRRKESALFEEDSQHGVRLFAGNGITDQEYHRRYPTIHHLILELMTDPTPHDVRLVYMACAWLVAHRGHFLFDIDPEQTDELLDFDAVYTQFQDFFAAQDYRFPWDCHIPAQRILNILQSDIGVRKKEEALKQLLFGGKKIQKGISEDLPCDVGVLLLLLAGGKVKPQALYCNEAYADIASVSLQMDDEEFDRIIAELDEDGILLTKLRSVYSCAQLIATMSNKRDGDPDCISSSKVAVYEQHKKDLATLKHLVRKYCPKEYHAIFRSADADNYVAYSGHIPLCPVPAKFKKVTKESFSEFIRKKMKGISVREEDRVAYENMMPRLENCSFLPKQKNTDNRVIPQQLYRQEMAAILRQAALYLPMLLQADSDGLTVSQKLLSIFDFRIPYYVGPLAKHRNSVAWIERKAGRILPWNFTQMVDLDTTERHFIRRMTNTCSYMAGEDVLPACSLLYERFIVLNHINNLQINGSGITTTLKQTIYQDLFMRTPRVTFQKIHNYLLQHGHLTADDKLTGIDVAFKGGLSSYIIFRGLLERGILREDDVERIILHATCTEDRSRMRRWLAKEFPSLPQEDLNYILRQKFKEFGRLSAKLLNGIYGTLQNSDGEAWTILEAMWHFNLNLMQLLSDRYTYHEQIQAHCRNYYADHPRTLTDRLSEMYVANAVKRPIFRTLDIISDIVKATGAPPKKIFVEMARGSLPEEKGKRPKTRKEQLLELYKAIKTEESVRFTEALLDMGAAADNRLQDRKLFLYYLQLGKCMYTGRPIELSRLSDGSYNLEHIYPQSLVKDDSILNNLVLVCSEINGQKSDQYPISKEIRDSRKSYWQFLKSSGLISEEKYRRLTRNTPFTADEKMGFIQRQLVETRQSTKVIAALLQERFPEAEIIYTKAGLVSEFRQQFNMLKSRCLNDLHHAKDAYLNIVVGNVYHERFTRAWFHIDETYNVQIEKIFAVPHSHGSYVYWRGGEDLALVRKVMAKDAVHLTRFAFYRKGGLFHQQPVKKRAGLIPLKKGLPTEKYGGYNMPTATGYLLAKAFIQNKPEIMLLPVNLVDSNQVFADPLFACTYAEEKILEITGYHPQNTQLLLDGRVLKINTLFSMDGVCMALAGKSGGGKDVLLSPVVALTLPPEQARYIKALESFQNKQKANHNLQPDEVHDGISPEKNVALYRLLTEKMSAWPFAQFPGNQYDTLRCGADKFAAADIVSQISCLMNILLMMGPGASAVNLSCCGGSPNAGKKVISAKLSNWKKRYSDVRIIDRSASGLYTQIGVNLLEQL